MLRKEPYYTTENFVRGFDMTVGQFYCLRESIIPDLLKDQLYRVDKNEVDTKYEVHELYAKLQEDPLLSIPMVYVYWKKQMIRNFVRAVAI
jgi:hypothetical protein